MLFLTANDTEHSTLGKMSNKSDVVCKDSDNSTKPPPVTHHNQTNKQKRTTKIPNTKSDDIFCGLNMWCVDQCSECLL
jgi:hypothetical protein